MKKIEVLFVFLGLAVVLASLTIPLWWDRAQPYIFGLPAYISGIIAKINHILRLLLDAAKTII